MYLNPYLSLVGFFRLLMDILVFGAFLGKFLTGEGICVSVASPLILFFGSIFLWLTLIIQLISSAIMPTPPLKMRPLNYIRHSRNNCFLLLRHFARLMVLFVCFSFLKYNLFFKDRDSLCSPSFPENSSVHQAGLEPGNRHASAFQALALKYSLLHPAYSFLYY